MRALLDFIFVIDPERRPSIASCIGKMKELGIYNVGVGHAHVRQVIGALFINREELIRHDLDIGRCH